MKLGTRIFLAYLLIFIACFYYPVAWLAEDLRTRYVEGIEDPLVDQATILAAMVGTEMENGRFSTDDLYAAFDRACERSLSARIYNLLKTRVDIRVYITDTAGKIVFDSANRSNIGADYSRWRDVSLTLRGEYGARTTHRDKETAVLYVAAPVVVHGDTAGVLTVGKPTTNVNHFMATATPRIFKIGMLSLAAAVLLSLIVSYWISRPIRILTRYADDVRAGRRTRLPKLGRNELNEMAVAFEKMREALEGKKYAKHYVQTLTHELKSPLSAITGAAELMHEEMPPETRARFLANIRAEARRIQDIVDRMLELSALENRNMLQRIETVSFGALVRTVIESKEPLLGLKELTVGLDVGDDIEIKGDSFLLHQAVSNLVQNAIDFSPVGGRIGIGARLRGKELEFSVDDEGPGIPESIRDKVFDRFFSLQRPDTGKKSTGLGLNFVKEVAQLHGGNVVLENRADKGLHAAMRLPVQPLAVSGLRRRSGFLEP